MIFGDDLKPGDFVIARSDITITLWPYFEVCHREEDNVPTLRLFGERDNVLSDIGVVIAVLDHPDALDGRIILIMSNFKLGYSRQQFLRPVR